MGSKSDRIDVSAPTSIGELFVAERKLKTERKTKPDDDSQSGKSDEETLQA